MKKIKVAIPLKTNSERVPNKNLRPFYKNESLFDIKAKQLLKVFYIFLISMSRVRHVRLRLLVGFKRTCFYYFYLL